MERPLHLTLKSTRHAAGISLEEATYGVRAHLPRSLWVSRSSIVRSEHERSDPNRLNPVLLMALCELYSLPIEELGDDIVHTCEQVRDLANRVLGMKLDRVKNRRGLAMQDST